MTEWSIVGQVGGIYECEGGTFKVNIADNRYEFNAKKNRKEKTQTVWLTCISHFQPTCKVGDRVIARGVFVPSKNENFPFALEIRNIGIIEKTDKMSLMGEQYV